MNRVTANVSTFDCELSYPEYGEGFVVIRYYSKPGHKWPGLSVVAHLGFKRHEVGVTPEGYGWTVREPAPELLAKAALCGLGLFPPAVFADWLEDNEEWVRAGVVSTLHGDPPGVHWRAVLSELRRY